MNIAVKPKVFIACPAYGQILTGQTTSALLQLNRDLMMHDMVGGFGTLSFPDISEIRNIFATIWYDKVQTSHMLFVDADMGFPSQLVLEMIAFDKPLVGALCPKRKLPIEFAGRAKAGECKIINGFLEVDGVGGAIMLIRRDCMDAVLNADPEIFNRIGQEEEYNKIKSTITDMRASGQNDWAELLHKSTTTMPMIDTITVKNHAARELLDQYKVERMLRVFDKIVVKGETFSEDLSFCKRWRAADQARGGTGDVWANVTHDIIHVGPHEFRGNYFSHIKDQVHPIADGANGAKPVTNGSGAPAVSPEAIPPEVQAALMQAAAV